jgi:hypothetical protein
MRHAIYEFDDFQDDASAISSIQFENSSQNGMLTSAKTSSLPSLNPFGDQLPSSTESKSTSTVKLPKINESQEFHEFKKRFMFHKPVLLKNEEKIKAEKVKRQIVEKWKVEKENWNLENKLRTDALMKQVDAILAASASKNSNNNPKQIR